MADVTWLAGTGGGPGPQGGPDGDPAHGHDARLEQPLLRCTGCRNSLEARDMPTDDPRLIRQAAIDIGWLGIGQPDGAQLCPACADRSQ
jgi:hypothetical protein